jgi:outer membrane receptor protein involved in Fe transport
MLKRCLLLVLLPCLSPAQMVELEPIEEAPTPRAEQPAEAPVILEEFQIDARTVVLSAARTRTTIQEAPGIITVITAEEIAQRGTARCSSAADGARLRGQPPRLQRLVRRGRGPRPAPHGAHA